MVAGCHEHSVETPLDLIQFSAQFLLLLVRRLSKVDRLPSLPSPIRIRAVYSGISPYANALAAPRGIRFQGSRAATARYTSPLPPTAVAPRS